MFTAIGLAGTAGVTSALLIGVSIFPTALVQTLGGNWRGVKKVESAVGTEGSESGSGSGEEKRVVEN